MEKLVEMQKFQVKMWENDVDKEFFADFLKKIHFYSTKMLENNN